MYRPVKAGEVFTTFIFDGKDCADMGVFSTTSSGTYTMYLEPTFKDEMLEVPGYDGRYYFGTQYSTQQFQFNMFADNLSIDEYKRLRTWLKPRKIGKLILSDQPYKYYLVKITNIGTLGEYPLTDIQTPAPNGSTNGMSGNIVYVGRFTVTFQTVGSVYGYGLSYYRDDLIYDAKNKYGLGVYPDNYYYDSGLLYKDMAPALIRTLPTNAEDYKLTIYNPGTATAIPIVELLSSNSYAENSLIEINNNTLNTTTRIDLSGLSGNIKIDTESELVITQEEDENGEMVDVNHYGRFTGNTFEISEANEYTYIPESFNKEITSSQVEDYDGIYITNVNGDTWAHINPLLFTVDNTLIGKYLCINGNGGAAIVDIDEENNGVKLDPNVLTYEILPATEDTPSGFECRYVGDYKTKDEFPTGNVGDVASITYTKVNSKGAVVVDRIEMYLYRYEDWAITNLFMSPDEFKDIRGDYEPRYLVFGANIISLDDITVSTNFGECDIAISLLPRYL